MINPDNFYRDDEYYFNPVLRNSPEGERLGYKAPEDDGFLRELGQGLVAGGARTLSGFEKTLRGDNIDPDYETELDKFLGRNPQLQAARDGKFSFGDVGRLVGEGTATSAAGFAVSAAVSAATANPFVGLAAGLATTYGQLYGDNVREIAAMRNNLPEGALSDAEIRGLAVGVTFIQSLIERAGFEYAIVRTLGGSARRNIAQALMGKMTRKEVLELAKSATTGSALRSGSRTFISGSLAEGIEEVAQLAVSDIAKMSTAGQSSFSDIKDYSDSFIAGAVGSMGIGTFTAIAQSRAASRMNEAITKMTADPFLIHNGDPESIKKTDAAIQAFKKQLTDGGVDGKLAEQFTGFMTAMAYKLTAMDMHSNKDLEITRMPEEYLTKFEVLMKDGVLTEDFIRKYQEADKAGTLEEFTKQNKETVDEMASVLIAEDELKAQAESWGIDRQVFTLYDEFQSAENKQDTQLYRAASSFLATAEPDKFGFYELDLNDPVGMAMEALTMSGPIEINGKQIANIRFDNGKVLVQEDIPQVETEGWLENSWNIQPQEKAEPTVDEEGNVQEDVGPDVYTPEELQASEDISEILYRIAIGEAKVTPDGRDFVNQALDAALESVRKQNVRPLRSTGELTSLGRKALIHAATLDVVAQYDEQPKRLQAPPPSYEEFVKSEHRRQVELDRIAFGEENADPEVEQAEVEAIVEERVGVVEEPAPTEVRDETTGTIRGAFVPRKNAEDLIILSQDYDATTLFEEVLHSLTVNNLIPEKTMSFLIEGYNKSVTDDAYKLRTDLDNVAEWSKSEEVAFHENIARYVMDAVRVGERSADPNVRFMQEALAKVWTEIGGLYNPAGMSKAELTERAEIDHVEDMLLKSWVPVESKGDPLFGARRSQIKKFLDFEREELDPIKNHIKNVAKDDPIRDELIKDLFEKTNKLWLKTGLFRSPMGYIAMEIPGEFRIKPNVARIFGFRDGFFEFRNYNSKFAKAYSRAISAKKPNEAKLDSIVAKYKDSFPMLKEVVDSDALEVLGLGNLRVGIFPTNEYLGRYHYSDGVILLSAGFIENGSHKFTEDDVKNPSIEDVIAHELQHAIQHLAFLVEPKFYRNASVTAVNDSENLDYRLEPEELDAEVAALRANGELDISVPPQASLRSYIRDIINDEGQDLDVERRVQLYKEATENILFQKAGTQSTAGDILDIQIDRANELLSKQFPGNLEDIAKFTERVKLGLNVLRHPTSLQEIDNAADDLKETLPKQSPGLFNVKYVEDFRRDAVKAYKQRVESIEQQGFDFLTQRVAKEVGGTVTKEPYKDAQAGDVEVLTLDISNAKQPPTLFQRASINGKEAFEINTVKAMQLATQMFETSEIQRVYEAWAEDNNGRYPERMHDAANIAEDIEIVSRMLISQDPELDKYKPKTKMAGLLTQKGGPADEVFLKKTDEMKKLGDYFAGFGEISADSSALGTMSFKHLKAGYLTSNNKRAAALHKLMGKRVENHREWLDTHFGKEKARDLTDDELDQAFSMLGGIAEPKKGPSPTRIPLYDTNAYNELTKHVDAEFDDSSDPRRLKGFAKSKQEFAHMMSEIGTQRFSSLRKILDRLDNYQPDGPWKKHILNRVLDAQNAYARNMQHVMAIRNKHAENGGIPTEGFFNEEVRLSDRTYKNSEILGIYLYARQLGEDVLLANNKDDRRWSVTQEAIDFAKKAVRENKELSNYVAFVDEVLVERRGAYDTASRLIRNKKLGVVEKHYFPVVRDSGSYVDEEKILQKLGAFNKHAKLTLEDTGKKAPGAMEEREYYRDKNGNPIVKDAFILDAASIFTNYVNSMERFATYGVARDEIANMLAISDDESAGTSPLAHLMYQKGLETEYKTLLDHVGALINPGRSLAPHGDSFGRALQTHVQHASMAFLGTNFSTVVKQSFSMPNALGLYDGSSIKLLPKALANYMSGIYHTKAGLWGAIKKKGSNFAGWDAYEKMAKYSPALASRMFDPDMMGLHRSAREGIMERVLSKELPGFKQNAKQLAFNGIRVMDGITVTSIWNAIVDGEIAKAGVDNEVTRRQAARIAEDIILQTQPPTDVSELNLWQRGTPLEQSLTPFSGYLMKHFEGTRTMISSATADWRRAKKLKDIDPEEAKRYRKRAQETASKRFFWHIVAPAMMLFMLNKGRPPEDEEEFLTAVFAGTVFSAPIVGGSLAGAAQGYSPEIGSTTWGRMMDASIETMSALYEAANGEPLDRKDARQMSEAFSLVTGTPYALFNMYFRASEGENIPQILGLFRQADEDN